MLKNEELTPFHLAVPVTNLEHAREFYAGMLGCEMGRSSEHWIDWNFFGHQFVTHLVAKMPPQPNYNQVDSKAVPVPHFGVVLNMPEWESLAERVSAYLSAKGQSFVVAPYIRFKGQVGEQGTFFLLDPSGNALEFKGFADKTQLFAS
ncbi:VOC family protein [Glaciecola sp. MH2013]|uniref:VOC family protein n=1 Tax=Glaciecola sp. MH2013 TaxID=2785524 RepID=UPI00189ECECA|nr:VOC family protein [Glaciecola sp. MH2013]MBF7074007.1 VOC family protein [Glaciecola sp. MH2013]